MGASRAPEGTDVNRAEIRHALQRGPAETLAEPLANLLEGLGWTLQEIHIIEEAP